jgi:hypothetical protein
MKDLAFKAGSLFEGRCMTFHASFMPTVFTERGRPDPSCRDRYRKASAVVARGRSRAKADQADPVVKDDKLVGIVSRSNLIQALASVVGRIGQPDETDRQIRLDLLSLLREQSWTDFESRNITVSNRIVHLWGLVGSEAERKALLALTEGVPGVSRGSDEMISAYRPEGSVRSLSD